MQNNCPGITATLDLIKGKWKPLLMFYLSSGSRRFGELHRLLPNATQHMVATQLRELEHDGLVERRVYAEVPPRVEYSLTPRGESVRGLLEHIYHWSEQQNLPA
ncbi:winged helix-turn-helix transcriptional regulator [Hymenobacter terrenus]|uniref:winged helix-turn-helix transcriptional regulator n=1 Tax=Hymenobacter terrenus TaxID=1629124 RepID=UPI000619CC6A|nr:helix-turn-helix domain-containing protein [Hymenobacter terrenus]